MNTFTMKTFADSYLYNEVARNAGDANNKAIIDFLIKSHRIDKNSNAFAGVIEDIKRQQTSSVLVSVLNDPRVILCIGEVELPAAFKVIDAKDSKDNKKPKVFIDVTGKIEYKDGYYFIKRSEIDKFCALLFDAVVYLLYRYFNSKLTNNSNITMLACECYVRMFNYINDYLRIIGYKENKKKISYIVALYFYINIIGYNKDDKYIRSVAAKIADINPRESSAYELYLQGIDFTNIFTFVNTLITEFKLKGLTFAVFINKWINAFGPGTEFGTELYTSFLCTIVNAYTGSYIVRQRQIESACTDANIAKLGNAIIRAGIDSLENRFREAADIEANCTIHSKLTEEMATAMNNKAFIESRGLEIKDFSDKDKAIQEAKNIIKACNEARLGDKIGKYAAKSIMNGIEASYNNCINILEDKEEIYEEGTILEVAKVFKNTLSNNQIYSIEATIDRDANILSEQLSSYEIPKDLSHKIGKSVLEFRQLKQYI